MKTVREIGAWRGYNRYGRDFKDLDVKKQIQVLCEELGGAHLHRRKVVSVGTIKARAAVCHQFIETLKAAGYPIKNVLNLDQRHVRAAVSHWIEQGLAASTVQTRMSILRWLATAIGKRGLVMDPSYYGVPAEAVAREYVAKVDKSWSAKDVLSSEMAKQAMAMDTWVGHQLQLMRVFGLRIQESIMLRPHIADQGNALRVEEGTKGGRTRIVPITTQEQRQVLDAAREQAKESARGSMCPPSKTVAQAKDRIYYIAGRKLGLRKAALGVTPHGLRHEFANDLYEAVSGQPSPVRGGPLVNDSVADDAARHQVSQQLGHARLRISGAYTGARKLGRPSNRPTSAPSDAAP